MPRQRPGAFPSPLPQLYAKWLNDLLPGPVPQETEATCDDCAMCRKGGAASDAVFFHPELKCCTYVPELPNFLVGRILADEDPTMAAGRASLEARVAARIAVTPLGVGTPPVQGLLYREVGGAVFGRARALRCPHFQEDGGRCGIWPHRNAVCATWFCKHVRGAVGLRFWGRLEHLLGAVEDTLAYWCVLELEVCSDALARLFKLRGESGTPASIDAAAVDGLIDADHYRSLWGNWHGREREFYEDAARRVDGLSWERILALGGPGLRILADLAIQAWTALTSRELPDPLVLGLFEAVPLGLHASRVVSHNANDPLKLSKALLDVLPYFDGRPTREVLRTIERVSGLTLAPSLLRKLTDFEILVPTSSSIRP